jgi:large subunit ribosomal protein L39e
VMVAIVWRRWGYLLLLVVASPPPSPPLVVLHSASLLHLPPFRHVQPSNKTFKVKQILAKKQRQNRPIPQWIRLRTDNTIRSVPTTTDEKIVRFGQIRADDAIAAYLHAIERLLRCGICWRACCLLPAVLLSLAAASSSHRHRRSIPCRCCWMIPGCLDSIAAAAFDLRPLHPPSSSPLLCSSYNSKRRHWRRTKLGI